ncbi:SGNH/GDSL hydrolase family protein [Daejeonella sp.]|uniref:SGNH/GDSL hydrolase family protein n=1 Tax=Daejeonella sp. TaxID=2805397 RepID=UPI0030BECEF9
MNVYILTWLSFLSIFFQPEKPKVLIIGDSISIGYFPFVKEALKDKGVLYHNAGNAQSSTNGTNRIKNWLGEEHWDVIQFNWGLWDIAYRLPALTGTGVLDKNKGKLTTPPEEYKANMEKLIAELEKTGAKLIFVNTSYVPRNEPGRHFADAKKYNRIAEKLARRHGVTITDLYKPSVKIHAELGLGTDNVHYSMEGYKKLSNYVTHGLANAMSLEN